MLFTIWWIGALISVVLMLCVGIMAFSQKYCDNLDYFLMPVFAIVISACWPFLPPIMTLYFYFKYWYDAMSNAGGN